MKEHKTVLKTINDDIFGDIDIIESTKLISFKNIKFYNENTCEGHYYDPLSLVKFEKKSIEISVKPRLFFRILSSVSNQLDTEYLQRRIKSSGIKDKDLLYVNSWNPKEGCYKKQDVLFVMGDTFLDIKNQFNEKHKNTMKGIDISIEPIFLHRDLETLYNLDKKVIIAFRSWAQLDKNPNCYSYESGDNFIEGTYIEMIPALRRNDYQLDDNLLKEW
jgi:hypothetical protein